ncbi:hypothetical protein [Salinicoccus roseus]|uniref:hypothetical protein n=1 Tax=Salinicoccus roseus TaxID=45670 RepID=UPI000F4F6623|nr:hypothetical protein [Salinicoccus roseus]RPE54808.1 hypothetical protein EDC33_1071 [Salinicoccus roseus]GGA62494.1 hypothetical protein GCM10007176_03630 [Salinicoccus roseus]
MINQFKEYNYPKQFILIEDEAKKVYKNLNSDQDVQNIDDYLWKVVTTVTQRNVEGKVYHKLQYEDKSIGWVELEDSIQIFRHSPRHFRVMEDEFSTNDINRKMGIDKDFISHFKGRLLNIKSEVFFQGERYYSVFIKNKFHGFHHEDVLDALVSCDISLDPAVPFTFHKISNLTKPVEIESVESLRLVSVFRKARVGKVLVNEDAFYWVALDDVGEDTLKQIATLEDEVKSEVELYIDDIFYSVNVERNKTKEMMSTLLSAKDFLKGKKHTQNPRIDATNSKQTAELKSEVEQYKKEAISATKQLELANRRLEQQKDYSNRLTEQRDRYKDRMTLVEQKLSDLNDRYKSLKEKYEILKDKASKKAK